MAAFKKLTVLSLFSMTSEALGYQDRKYGFPHPQLQSFFVWVIFSSPPLQLCKEGFCNSSFRIPSLSRFFFQSPKLLNCQKGSNHFCFSAAASAFVFASRPTSGPTSRGGPARLRWFQRTPEGAFVSCSREGRAVLRRGRRRLRLLRSGDAVLCA